MDLRESMSVSGSGSYYIHKGFHESGSGVGSGTLTHSGLHASPGYMPITNPNISGQSNVRDNSLVSAFSAENASPNIGYGLNMGLPSSGGGGGGGGGDGASTADVLRKKRGRPRKYGPGGTHMSLEISTPMSPPTGQIVVANPKKSRGRPPGSGRKQQLAKVGEWMRSSAGMAFTPHIINVDVGEDIASKVLSFAQNRQRALCIISGSGRVSAVSFRQQTPSSSTNSTFEGNFQILCLSGSYLVDEKGSGGDPNRTGGISVSLCSPDGHVIGGAVGGMLIASTPTKVIVSSFIYGGNKPTGVTKMMLTEEKKKKKKKKSTKKKAGKKSGEDTSSDGSPNETSDSSTAGGWDDSRLDLRNPPQRDIDLTSG